MIEILTTLNGIGYKITVLQNGKPLYDVPATFRNVVGVRARQIDTWTAEAELQPTLAEVRANEIPQPFVQKWGVA